MSPRPKDFESCDRCGAMVLRQLAQFHQCKGTDMSRRPANVSQDSWNAAVAKALNLQLVVKTAADPKKAVADVRDKIQEGVRAVREGRVYPLDMPKERKSFEDRMVDAAKVVFAILALMLVSFGVVVLFKMLRSIGEGLP